MEDSPFLPQLKQWASWGPDREEEMEKLYREFASEDKMLAEEGVEDYTAGLLKEDEA